MVKHSKIGSTPRKRLADMSNLPQQSRLSVEEKKQQSMLLMTNEYVDKLQKENMTLMKLLGDRNKIIELSGIELQKLRTNLQKLQLQNLQLAQANSQMLAELNSGKDRLKALQHELGCKNGLLKARKLELGELKAKVVTCPSTRNEVGKTKCDKEEEISHADKKHYQLCNTDRHVDKKENKLCNTNRRWKSRRESLGSSVVKRDLDKEKDEDKRCLRRQSARFKSEEPRSIEDSFEIDDTKLPASFLDEDAMHERPSMPSESSLVKIEDEGNADPTSRDQEFRRSSISRPLRRAAIKVQSYKEIPINVKMRRDH